MTDSLPRDDREENSTYRGSRDVRFVTIRRGGLLDDATHRALVRWAADCAEHVVGLFQDARPDDTRPADAIATAHQWASGEVTMTRGREAAYAAHAAAREVTGAASEAARAAGHAVATAHMADHELGAAFYALRAREHDQPNRTDVRAAEKEWQVLMLPDEIHDLVLDDMHRRAKKFRNAFA